MWEKAANLSIKKLYPQYCRMELFKEILFGAARRGSVRPCMTRCSSALRLIMRRRATPCRAGKRGGERGGGSGLAEDGVVAVHAAFVVFQLVDQAQVFQFLGGVHEAVRLGRADQAIDFAVLVAQQVADYVFVELGRLYAVDQCRFHSVP